MNNIVLIGFMGSGKSTVGRLLAERLKRPFRDLDDEIATATGQPIAITFEREGEEGFRRRESDCLRAALEADGQVIAVGGGAPLVEENWARLRDGNTVVALTAEPRELAERLRGSTDRPLLYPDPPTALARLLPVRTPRYLEA
ncbi:MAG: shikimate kinase, partial [Candidatus Dormibacteraeota bacterium]|nr:shikimate kinase [Candidatus Dormibacteraeota bacterium]